MASDPPAAGPGDPVMERRDGALAWGISELAYTQMQDGARAHALFVRTTALPAGQPWTCAGPRNIGGRITALAQDPSDALILYAGGAHGGLFRTLDGGDTWDQVSGRDHNEPIGALAIHPARPRSVWIGTGSHNPMYVSGSGIYRLTIAADGTVPPPRLLAPAPPGFEPPASMTTTPGLRGAALRYTQIELDPEDPNAAFVASQTGLWHCIDADDGTPPSWLRLLPSEPAAHAPGDTDPLGTPPLSANVATQPNATRRPYVTDLRVARDPRSAATIDLGDGHTAARHLIVFAAVSGVGTGSRGGVFRGRFDRQARTIRWDAAAAAGIPAPPAIVPAAFARARLAICRSQPRFVYAVFEDGGGAEPCTIVYRSADAGDSWTAGGLFAGGNRQASYSMVLEVHPDDPQLVVGGTIDLGLSTDGGTTFAQILDWSFYDRGDHSQHADQHALLFDNADRRKLWSSNDGGLSMARDLSAPVRPGYWRKRSHGIVAGQFQDLSVFPPHPSDPGARLRFLTCGGLQDNGSWISYGGPTWYHIGWADGSGSAIHAQDPRAVFSAQNGWCNYPTIRNGIVPGTPRIIRSQVVADIAAVERALVVGHSWFPLNPPAAGGPFVGCIAQDPRPANAGQVIYSWGVDTTPPPPATPLAYRLTVASPAPALTADLAMPATTVTSIPAPAPVINGESTTALAFGPVGGARVDGWIGTDQGRLIHTTDAPLGTAGAWAPVASFPPNPLGSHQPDRIVVHPADRRIVAVAASERGAGPLLASRTVTLSVLVPGPIGTAQVTLTVGGTVSGAFVTAAILEVPGSGLVLGLSGAAFALGDAWTIGVDNDVQRVGATASDVTVVARLHGRVLLSYDRGASWTDVSRASAVPAAPARGDSDSLPFCPVTSLCWDTGPGGAGPLRLFAGTLAGVYVLENLPAPPAMPPALPPPAPGGPLAGFNPRWRPFAGTPTAALPLALVNDIEMLTATRILRVATFGRGIWDCDLDGAPRHRLFIRQTVVEDGRLYPRVLPATLRDDPRVPAGRLWMDHAHAFDIRVDTAPFDVFDDVVDGVEFDERMGVDDIAPLQRQAVYVQVHNSGWDTAHAVDVHLLWTGSPAAPLAVGGPAPAALMPIGLPDAATFYAPPNFPAAAPWSEVAPPRRIAQVRAGEPKVVRFDWTPPESLGLAGSNVALLALCTAADDPLPAALAGGVVTMADFIAAERRAALRIVPVRPIPTGDLFIRDGVDDDARTGSVAFVGRSPDIIAVQAPPADPPIAFADLLDPRAGDVIRGGVANTIFVRVHNRGATAALAEVRLWAVPVDSDQRADFAIANWVMLTAAPPATGAIASVPAGGTALLAATWTNPPDPNPADVLKAWGLVATIGSTGGADPPADVPNIASEDEFWRYFGERFGSDNAALRVLRYVP